MDKKFSISNEWKLRYAVFHLGGKTVLSLRILSAAGDKKAKLYENKVQKL